MFEPSKAFWLALAYAACVAGFSWLALAMQVHWQQVQRELGPSRPGVLVLRVLGALGLVGGGLACLRADHPSIAALVWVLMLTASALTVTLVLTWRPALLRPFAACVPSSLPASVMDQRLRS